MNSVIREFSKVLMMDDESIRRIAKSKGPLSSAARIVLILCKAYDRRSSKDPDLGFKTAKNGKVYPLNEKTGEIINGPLKGVKVSPPPQSNIQSLPPKTQKKAHEMSKAIASGKVKLSNKKMSSHIANSPAYRKHAADMASRGYKPSHFDCDYADLEKSVVEALKSRNAHYFTNLNGDVKAQVILDHPVGTVYTGTRDTGHQTNCVTAVYSPSDGDWHFYPDDLR